MILFRSSTLAYISIRRVTAPETTSILNGRNAQWFVKPPFLKASFVISVEQ